MKETSPRHVLRMRPDTIVNNILIVALVILAAFFWRNSPSFLTMSNISVILTNYAAIGVVVAVMCLLVIAGHVDLSVGSNIGFSGMIVALAITDWGVSPALAIVLGLCCGAVIGAVNGLLCAVMRFNPVIVTLGMLSVLRGVTLLIHSVEVSGLGDLFGYIANGSLLSVPILLWIVAGVFLLSVAFLGFTVWGRYVYAIGINPQAAFLAALPVKPVIFGLYVATGIAASASGIMLAARLDGASPGSSGLQMELQSLTIILLGPVTS